MKKLLLILLVPIFVSAQSQIEMESVYDQIENNNWDESLNLINDLLSNYPSSAHLHFLKGYVFDYKENIYSARINLEKAIELNSDHTLASGHLAGIYFREEKFLDAIPLFKKHILVNSDDLELASNTEFNIAVCYSNSGNFEEALSHYTNVISINNNDEIVADAYWNRGVTKNNIKQASGCADLNEGYDRYMEASRSNLKWGFPGLKPDYMYNSYCDSKKLNNIRFKIWKKEAKRLN